MNSATADFTNVAQLVLAKVALDYAGSTLMP